MLAYRNVETVLYRIRNFPSFDFRSRKKVSKNILQRGIEPVNTIGLHDQCSYQRVIKMQLTHSFFSK